MKKISINFISLMNQDARLRVVSVLLAMSVACCMLAVFRVYWTKNITYIYLIWNLFLAWIPLLIAYFLQRYNLRFPKKYSVLCFSSFLWLLFFPNSPYIITDLIHLDSKFNVPLWFDAMMIFSFALTGLIAGFLSLYFMHEILNKLFNKIVNWLLILMTLILTGYGIYLGRILRWNSWDIFTNTRPLLLDVTGELNNPHAIFMTLSFTFFMIFSYLILHSIIHLKEHAANHDQNKQMS
jgi:uncharacterized membrane protein